MKLKELKKPKKPPAWSHPATARCRIAAKELIRVKRRQKILAAKSKLLQQIVIEEGGGAGEFWRAAIRHVKGGFITRSYFVKPSVFVSFLK